MPFDPTILKDYPGKPGVYIMKSSSGAILYIGKAINLKQRVRQYFGKSGDGRVMIPFLIEKVESIETIIVTSEKEALLLENNLIKKHKPKYNALLKDDKAYIALKMTKHEWPRVDIVRYKGKPKADGVYFGPYTSATAARQTLDLLHKVFPMRQCSDQEFARRTRPCILYDIKRCVAPCVGYCTKEEYTDLVRQTTRFLKGQDRTIINELHQQMMSYSDQLEFEKAAAIQKTIKQIEKTIEGQQVDQPLGVDMDVLGVYREGSEVIVSLMFYRGGALTGTRHYNFSEIGEDDNELIQTLILQHYHHQDQDQNKDQNEDQNEDQKKDQNKEQNEDQDKDHDNVHYYELGQLPHEILIPVEIGEVNVIADLLSEGKSRKVLIHHPKKGKKLNLIEMAQANAEAAFKKEKDEGEIRERTLLEMQEKFRLTHYPRRMECFDVSNISGTNPVATLVAFSEGKKDLSRYRKYKIQSVDVSDDYGAMREVLSRRFKVGQDQNEFPDLLIVDGGKGHLNVALSVLKELNIITVNVISVAKEEGRHDKGMTSERVFLPNVKDPISFAKNSQVLFLLQQIRDEAHRTAITFHRARRSKELVKSVLDDIPGIGPAKKKALLKHFGSLKKIREASLEELGGVKGISEKDAGRIFDGVRSIGSG